ncbi:MAG: tRNA (adenosine(37)-N6)-dimethylallyltransferase MiaA [Phycisphaerales bacterium]|nr:tRNA (adenosine(37)-N6)-dimethylallyltransferase MiaA [Phycisphaerales bacterium]
MQRYPVIVGPTAGGKTSLAIALARLYHAEGQPAEIVTADAFQIYRGMDIGTAKPTPEEQGGIPHHLIDIVDPIERFTVHDWLTLAEPMITAMRAREIVPIVVGGTNLYIKSFLDGMFSAPEPTPEIRGRVREMAQDDRRRLLEEADPKACERIHPSDQRRTARALEVYLQTGTPISELQRQWEAEQTHRPEAVLVGLDWDADAIKSRANRRVKIMVEQGLVDEVRGLWEGCLLGDQAVQAIGYKQLIAHFERRCSLDDAIERVKIETRRLAKNQRTWLRRLRPRSGSVWIKADMRDAGDLAREALNHMQDGLSDEN